MLPGKYTGNKSSVAMKYCICGFFFPNKYTLQKLKPLYHLYMGQRQEEKVIQITL